MQNHFGFVSSFDHVKFVINGKYFKNIYDNLNYYVSLVIFQTYKNVVLKSVHSLGWLLWLCFYPNRWWFVQRFWDGALWMWAYFKEEIQKLLCRMFSTVSTLFTSEEIYPSFWLHAPRTIISKPIQKQKHLWIFLSTWRARDKWLEKIPPLCQKWLKNILMGKNFKKTKPFRTQKWSGRSQ
jgi:hypothetical protein